MSDRERGRREREREREIERERETDRERDRQTDRQTEIDIGGQRQRQRWDNGKKECPKDTGCKHSGFTLCPRFEEI